MSDYKAMCEMLEDMEAALSDDIQALRECEDERQKLIPKIKVLEQDIRELRRKLARYEAIQAITEIECGEVAK